MKKCLLSELLHLDMREGMQVLTQEDRARRVVIKALKSIIWLLWKRFHGGKNLKSLFLKEGDNNTFL